MRSTCFSSLLTIVSIGLLAALDARSAQAQRLDDWEAQTSNHPPDPFASDYALPRERELGTAAGQFRMIGSAMLVAGPHGLAPGLHGTLELLTFAYLSFRGSLQMTIAAPAFEPVPVFIAKTGPSLHLLPYRRVDLSIFFEGGVGVVSATKRESAPMPVASPGASFELWMSPWAFLRLEGHVDCGFYPQAGQANKYVRFGSLFGLGIAL